jgi:N-acetyl-gamma-glutamyl-phosphate reductase
MARGELVTCHLKLAGGATIDDVRAALMARFKDERFIKIAPTGASPDTRWVRGSNLCVLAVFPDRIPGRVIVIGVIDNLIKGSGGQAIQNMNIAFGLSESQGLTMEPLFP